MKLLRLLPLLPGIVGRLVSLLPPKVRAVVGPALWLTLGLALPSALPQETGCRLEVDVHSSLAWSASRLSQEAPVGSQVVVDGGDLLELGFLGVSIREPRLYTILLDSSLSRFEQEMVLAHEWAHLLVWAAGEDVEDPHGPEWGREYARVHRTLTK